MADHCENTLSWMLKTFGTNTYLLGETISTEKVCASLTCHLLTQLLRLSA